MCEQVAIDGSKYVNYALRETLMKAFAPEAAKKINQGRNRGNMKPSQSMFDYAKLRGSIREHFGTEGAYAKAIGRSSNYVSKVFQGKSNFSVIDVAKSAEVLGIASEDIGKYFFEKRS